MSSLTPTARVILGMLKLGVPTGYEIKKVIDDSTRFFWTASYGSCARGRSLGARSSAPSTS
jgi:DNA-binding PadR family transcriptional regulator